MSALKTKNLTVGYGSKTVLRDISLELPAGCCVLLAGANGSGKSTLLKTLGGLLPPLGGEMTAEGGVILLPTGIPKVKGFTVRDFVNTSFYAYTRGAANVGRASESFVPNPKAHHSLSGCALKTFVQNVNSDVPSACGYPDPAFETSLQCGYTSFSSVAMPNDHDVEPCVHDGGTFFSSILSSTAMPNDHDIETCVRSDSAFSLPTWVNPASTQEDCMRMALEMLGIEDFVDRDISTLSDGEFQKACIATAVARLLVGSGRGVLLLDEPSAFLDVDCRASLAILLKRLAHDCGVTVIYSSHDIYGPLASVDHIMAISTDGSLLFSDPSASSKHSALSAAFSSYRG